MKQLLTLLLLPITLVTFGQKALSCSMMLRASQQGYSYVLSNDNGQHVYSGNIKETKAALLNFSLIGFNDKKNYNRWDAFGWNYGRQEALQSLYEDSTNLQFPLSSTDLLRIGGGIRYERGWRVRKINDKLAIFINAFASGHYQYFESGSRTSQGYPLNVHAINMEIGVGFTIQRDFGDTWFMKLGVPVPFYEVGFYRLSYQNPSFSWKEGLQKTWHHNFRYWERNGIEIGAGFYLRVKCKN